MDRGPRHRDVSGDRQEEEEDFLKHWLWDMRLGLEVKAISWLITNVTNKGCVGGGGGAILQKGRSNKKHPNIWGTPNYVSIERVNINNLCTVIISNTPHFYKEHIAGCLIRFACLLSFY
jgi:hypothetical protein